MIKLLEVGMIYPILDS